MKNVIGVSTELQRSTASHPSLRDSNLSHDDQASVMWDHKRSAVCLLPVHLSYCGADWLVDWLLHGLFDRPSVTGCCHRQVVCRKQSEQNKAKFAFNMTLTIRGELSLSLGMIRCRWDEVWQLSRQPLSLSLRLLLLTSSAAGKEQP